MARSRHLFRITSSLFLSFSDWREGRRRTSLQKHTELLAGASRSARATSTKETKSEVQPKNFLMYAQEVPGA